MATAQCTCGALRLTFGEPPQLTALCHCLACQRRTGAPFSANAFYSVDCIEISGASTEFVRTADSGRKVRMHFCPTCGSTVFWKAEAAPSWMLICRPDLRATGPVSVRTVEAQVGAA